MDLLAPLNAMLGTENHQKNQFKVNISMYLGKQHTRRAESILTCDPLSQNAITSDFREPLHTLQSTQISQMFLLSFFFCFLLLKKKGMKMQAQNKQNRIMLEYEESQNYRGDETIRPFRYQVP